MNACGQMGGWKKITMESSVTGADGDVLTDTEMFPGGLASAGAIFEEESAQLSLQTVPTEC